MIPSSNGVRLLSSVLIHDYGVRTLASRNYADVAGGQRNPTTKVIKFIGFELCILFCDYIVWNRGQSHLLIIIYIDASDKLSSMCLYIF
jgi:hypothetical protein